MCDESGRLVALAERYSRTLFQSRIQSRKCHRKKQRQKQPAANAKYRLANKRTTLRGGLSSLRTRARVLSFV